jgi:hypothetical protein
VNADTDSGAETDSSEASVETVEQIIREYCAGDESPRVTAKHAREVVRRLEDLSREVHFEGYAGLSCDEEESRAIVSASQRSTGRSSE